MMQVPHRLGKEVLGVIYMSLQTSTPELAFMVELGGPMSRWVQIALSCIPFGPE